MTGNAMLGLSPIAEENAAEFLTQRELATRWKISIRTLERWRGERYGPAWISIGGSIRYCFADVQAFEVERRCF
jgi:hypothetical protein